MKATFHPAEQRTQSALSTVGAVALGAVAVGCCVGCAVVAAHFSGFPLFVLAGCGCVLALAALAALVVYPHVRDVPASSSSTTRPERR
jgi:hypothetical protein